MDRSHHTKPPLSGRATFWRNLAFFFSSSFFLPWKIFDVNMFLLETAPRVTEVKGPVLFGMLCNWELAEEKVLKEISQK